MTVHFREVKNFHRLPPEEAKRILYEELLPTCEAQQVQLAPEGHVPGVRYTDRKRDHSVFDVERVQRAFAVADRIYRPGKKYRDIWKPLFEHHPRGGYVGGGELMAAMMLKGYPAKFGEEGATLNLRAQFPVKRACSGHHKSRLFVGEGCFSGVDSFMRKHRWFHDGLGESIIATELETLPVRRERVEDSLEELECHLESVAAQGETNALGVREISYMGEHAERLSGLARFLKIIEDVDGETGFTVREISSMEQSSKELKSLASRLDSLKGEGVTIGLGVDATKIHTHPITGGRRFERIHWNCPHDGSDYRHQTLPPIIEQFFASATQLQQEGDRIHITLAQPRFDRQDRAPFYQAVIYNIHRAANSSGYTLYAKRPFGSERYPGYKHQQTNRMGSAAGANRLREFIFIKGPLPEDRIPAAVHSEYFRPVFQERNYYVRDTDDESSACSRSSSPSYSGTDNEE